MKIHKRGFSLAELLLTIGIIGVITALGLTITKQTADNAYRKFYSTGYSNLYNMIAEFEKDNLFDAAPLPATGKQQITDATHFAQELGRLLGVSNNGTAVTARNGIRYQITDLPNGNSNPIVNYRIDMTVPQARTRQNPSGTASARFVYLRENFKNQPGFELIPINGPPGYTNVLERQDLLPFYVDTGRRRQNKQVMNFRTAYCNCYGKPPKVAPDAGGNQSDPQEENNADNSVPASYEPLFNCPGIPSSNLSGTVRLKLK